jgi:hypothetical protein
MKWLLLLQLLTVPDSLATVNVSAKTPVVVGNTALTIAAPKITKILADISNTCVYFLLEDSTVTMRDKEMGRPECLANFNTFPTKYKRYGYRSRMVSDICLVGELYVGVNGLYGTNGAGYGYGIENTCQSLLPLWNYGWPTLPPECKDVQYPANLCSVSTTVLDGAAAHTEKYTDPIFSWYIVSDGFPGRYETAYNFLFFKTGIYKP